MSKKLVTSDALEMTIDLTKSELIALDKRLDNVENTSNTVTEIDQPVNQLANVGNVIEVTKVAGNTIQDLWNGAHKTPSLWVNGYRNLVDQQNGYAKMECVRDAVLNNGYLPLKPSTEYTFIFHIIENTLDNSLMLPLKTDTANKTPFETSYFIPSGSLGTVKVKVRTISNISDIQNDLWFYTGACTTGSITFKTMLLEGDWTNKTIPYIQGIQSVDNVEIKSIGKNLLDVSKIELGQITWAGGEDYKVSTTRSSSYEYIPVETGATLYRNKDSVLFLYDENRKYLGFHHVGEFSNTSYIKEPYTIEDPVKYIRISFSTPDVNSLQNSYLGYSSDLTYEPYIEPATLQIPLTEPLRKIGDIADTIEGNKIIRRIGKAILNTTTYGVGLIKESTVTRTSVDCPPNMTCATTDPPNNFIVDNFPVVDRDVLYIGDIEYGISQYINQDGSLGSLFINVPASMLPSANTSGLKTWLLENPITIYYQLLEPYEEEINFNEILETYPNGYIVLRGDVTPTVTVEYATGLIGRLLKTETEVADNRELIEEIKDVLTVEEITNYWNSKKGW